MQSTETSEFSAISSCLRVSVNWVRAAFEAAYSLLHAAVIPVTPTIELMFTIFFGYFLNDGSVYSRKSFESRTGAKRFVRNVCV